MSGLGGPWYPCPPVRHPRCECHDCTQARRPLINDYANSQYTPLPSAASGREFTGPTQAEAVNFIAKGHDNKIRDAERERCAKIAETLGVYPELNVHNGGPEWYKQGQVIAAKIRSGE